MPTEVRLNGLRIEIYTNDHRPAHVHVNGKGGTAVFELNCPEGPPALREVCGFSLTQVNRMYGCLVDHLPHLCLRWRKIHGSHR